MKKILLPLFLIATSMKTTRLSAYCFYNYSKNKTIYVYTYESKQPLRPKTLSPYKARHELSPKDGKGCWNWKSIDKNDQKKLWYWVAYSKSLRKLGQGYFPIGGAVYYSGWTTRKGMFEIYYNGKPWEYWKSPWNWPQSEKPWKTYKR